MSWPQSSAYTSLGINCTIWFSISPLLLGMSYLALWLGPSPGSRRLYGALQFMHLYWIPYFLSPHIYIYFCLCVNNCLETYNRPRTHRNCSKKNGSVITQTLDSGLGPRHLIPAWDLKYLTLWLCLHTLGIDCTIWLSISLLLLGMSHLASRPVPWAGDN